jgi:DNA-binding NarL/FixJ family response regulator
VGFSFALEYILILRMNSPLRVFVIEDSPILLERIAEAIADQPSLILVGTADCEKEALAKIRTLKPEALVVDIKLREGNGLNVLAQLKWGEGDDAKPKIVVFTNYPRQEYLRNSKQLGADYFLDKSTQFSDLPKVLIGLSDDERSEHSLGT